MSSNDQDKIVYVNGTDYKTYKGFKYHKYFPDEWILNEKEDTGRECPNCVGEEGDLTGYAMYNEIILGYCVNCAAEEYYFQRGCGFEDQLVECEFEGQSAFETYLKGVDCSTIGKTIQREEDDEQK